MRGVQRAGVPSVTSRIGEFLGAYIDDEDDDADLVSFRWYWLAQDGSGWLAALEQSVLGQWREHPGWDESRSAHLQSKLHSRLTEEGLAPLRTLARHYAHLIDFMELLRMCVHRHPFVFSLVFALPLEPLLPRSRLLCRALGASPVFPLLCILTLLSPVRLIFLSPFLFLGPLSPARSLASSDETVEDFSDEWIDIYILDRFVQELEAQDADEGYLQASRAGVLPLVLAVARGQMSAEEANAAMASVASQDGAAGETAAERVPDARAPASALAASVRG